MGRIAIFVYGVVSYAIFFATFLYAIGFVANIGVPTTLDGPATGSALWALAINVALLTLFALQHSIMARPAFKQWWTRTVPPAAERSTYVLFSSLALALLFWAWQPMGGIIWDVSNPVLRGLLVGLCALGFGIVLVTTFLINHFDLFGLRQVWLHLRGREYTPLAFRTPGLYRYVRHPLYVGWFFAFWATPTMTAAHFLFAMMTTGYILAAIRLEERDLETAHPEYAAYRESVPMLVPRVRGAAPGETPIRSRATA